MLRKTLGITMLLVTSHAYADYRCAVNPQDDITITPTSVVVDGTQGKLQISPQGTIIFKGKTLAASDALRQQAQSYQAALRQDLPWINQGARSHLTTAKMALDRVITQQLGAESKVHQRLASLESSLQQQMDKILLQQAQTLSFHHQAIDEVRNNSQQLIQNTLGGMLQDSLNELGNLKNTGSTNSNPLQALVGNLGGLQQSVQHEWAQQEQDFQNFGDQVCQRVTKLQQQRHALFNALK